MSAFLRKGFKSPNSPRPKGFSPTKTSIPIITHCSHKVCMSTGRPDWNNDSSLFTFTRGRFVFDEARQMQQRTVKFDMNRLAQVAASSIGAESCVAVTKCPDGMYAKAYIMRMSDGREVIAKVPNPNAGVPHYTTASEVATIDFVREVLKKPAPKVHAWSSRVDKDNGVGAEYIIMEKAPGEPLDRFWDRMSPSDKLKVLAQVLSYNRSWLSFSFPGYGSLYYESDAAGGRPSSAIPVGKGFVIGPATGRDWHDADRLFLDCCDRGPWTSVIAYRRAVAARERAAIRHLPPAKQMVMIAGPSPELYTPTPAKKLSALDSYGRLLPRILQTVTGAASRWDPVLASPFLWHDDLHGENVLVDPSDPTRITAVIDWQGVQVVPLFDHNAAHPAFLDYYSYAAASENDIIQDSKENEDDDDVTLPPMPDTPAMSEADRAAAHKAYIDSALCIAWRRLVRKKAPALDDLAKFQESTEGNLLHVSRRVYEVGESLLAGLALELELELEPLKLTTSTSGDDDDNSDETVRTTTTTTTTIRSEMDAASAGIDLMGQLREQMGEEYWPDKGLTAEKDYERVKAMLSQARDEMAEGLFGEDEAKREEFKRGWPF